jgi:hypothetical protein
VETKKEDGRLKHLDKARAEGLNSRKGKPNKSTAAIKEMLEQSLQMAGGANYFHRQSEENPSAYMQLIGKILPKNLEAIIDINHQITVIERKIVKPKDVS